MVYCLECGGPVSAGDRYCGSCGMKLQGRGSPAKRVECRFCDATGVDPGDGDLEICERPCRVCKGNKGRWVPEDWGPCQGECGGNGKIDIRAPFAVFPHFSPCKDCGGWGWVVPR